ncbi:GNAT family N-acetyltransferase [Thalassotalea litorea]|uniref:GNAT family N-acetyltransferase n=1 Tax=Thalassotalea litorea TaxID=2020715 RepID=A0A5R9IF43_9GAMM|nr:GNAT family N-acetyltransferase [Thalassotalea litorea]TLU64145.1 GNAT family N-acetyltransferase [Thalassotalea litorea]
MSEFLIETADKSDKKAIQRFYKQQRYSARFLGDDATYLVRDNQDIIASVIISFKDSHSFLHALVVDNNHRGQGIAQSLLAKAAEQHPQLYCFCGNELMSFYQKQHFAVIEGSLLPDELRQRYLAYRKKHELIALYLNSN